MCANMHIMPASHTALIPCEGADQDAGLPVRIIVPRYTVGRRLICMGWQEACLMLGSTGSGRRRQPLGLLSLPGHRHEMGVRVSQCGGHLALLLMLY